MAATITISETNGTVASPVETASISNVNMGSVASADLVAASYPITAAADGHGFEKWLRFYVTDLGDSTQIDNLKIWLSDLGGGWKTGEGMSTNCRETSYVKMDFNTDGPVATDSADADQAVPETEPTGANLGIAGSLSGAITSAPDYSDYAVFQLDVTASTPAGSVNQKTFTFQYDEQ